MTDQFVRPQGRRTIRRTALSAPGTPMMPSSGRQPRNIRMWDLGDGEPSSTKEKLRRAYLGALDAVDAVEARKADALKSGKFTPAGAADDALQFALSELVPAFKQGRNTIDAAKREAKSLRDEIRLQSPDKSDVVGAMRRREMREFLRGMPAKERNAYVSQRRESMDPDLALAIVEMPAEFSGVIESDRNDLLDRALEAQHGENMTQLKKLESAIEIAESAVETGRDEVRLETGLDAQTFNDRATPFEAKTSVPWLRRRKAADGTEQTVVVDLERGVERPATPEEIHSGAFYRDAADYRNSNPDTRAAA